MSNDVDFCPPEFISWQCIEAIKKRMTEMQITFKI